MPRDQSSGELFPCKEDCEADLGPHLDKGLGIFTRRVWTCPKSPLDEPFGKLEYLQELEQNVSLRKGQFAHSPLAGPG